MRKGWIKIHYPINLLGSNLDRETLDYLQSVIQSGREEAKIDLKRTLALNDERSKADLAKDISAIANTPGENNGYIIIGVHDPKQRTSNSPDDHINGFQTTDEDAFWRQIIQVLNKYLDPPPRIEYHVLVVNAGKSIGVIEIPRSYSRPHAIKRTSGDIEEHQVWVRRGSSNCLATREEQREMHLGSRRWTLVNFSTHPLTDEHKRQIRCLGYGEVERVIEAPVSLNDNQPFAKQVEKIIHSTNLTPHQWQTLSVLISLPGFSPAAGLILAQLHGRMGNFPVIIRVRRAVVGFEVAEVINLNEEREKARLLR